MTARSVPKVQLSKVSVKNKDELGELHEEAEAAAKVDTTNRNRFTLSLSDLIQSLVGP